MAESHEKEPRIPQPTPERRGTLPFKAWWVRHNLLPPHLIVWRLLWAAPAYICLAVTSLVLLIGWGPDLAKKLWEEFT